MSQFLITWFLICETLLYSIRNLDNYYLIEHSKNKIAKQAGLFNNKVEAGLLQSRVFNKHVGLRNAKGVKLWPLTVL